MDSGRKSGGQVRGINVGRGRTEIPAPESAASCRLWETQGVTETLVGSNFQAMRRSFTAQRSESEAHRTDALDVLTQEQTQVGGRMSQRSRWGLPQQARIGVTSRLSCGTPRSAMHHTLLPIIHKEPTAA